MSEKKEIIEGVAVVYKIVCLANCKTYIGSTVNFSKRKSDHFKILRGNCHHSKPMQNSFNKYGEVSFEMSIIESFPYQTKEDILLKEQSYMDELKPAFNVYPTAGSPLGVRYGKYSPERRKKLSDGMKGIPKSKEHKEKLSSAKLSGTANDKAVIAVYPDGMRVEYRSICEANRLSKIGLQTIYDSLNNKPKRWRHKKILPKWMYKPEIN